MTKNTNQMKLSAILKQNLLLICGLGALALLRPILKITGLMDLIGQQLGSILITALITVAWIVIVLMKKTAYPVIVLVGAGISYAVFATILSGTLSPILTGELQGPLKNPFAIVSVLVVNALWGFIAGGLANLLRR
ncbi:hypothetical protein ACFQZE_23435 [Paenibacillus sp. GCM10027627]|uniref:hypothetical protein n=1 Tax=unclassified Paenibacillus TaxID=185978 RepID=UPI003628AF00